MLTVAICDDNKVFLEMITGIVDKSMQKVSMEHEIQGFLQGEAFLTQHRAAPFDVVFLDIAMPDMDGFEVAKEIRRISENTYIIFVTTESSLVYDSFEFTPFYFIPKASVEQLEDRIDHVAEKLSKNVIINRPIRFDLPYGDTRFILPLDIIALKSNKNYVDIYTVKGEYVRVRENTEELIQRLPNQLFARIHNRYTVNMKHIENIDFPNSEVHLSDGSALRISRTHKKVFKDEYNIFLRSIM